MNCTDCSLCVSRKHIVEGFGSANKLMVISEYPSYSSDRKAKPFQSKSERRFTNILSDYGFNASNTYFTYLIKCRPNQGRVPTEEEVKICSKHLVKEINLIKPKLILLVGSAPLKLFCKNNNLSVSKSRGIVFEMNGFLCINTFNIKYIINNNLDINILINDIKTMYYFYKQNIDENLTIV